VANVCPELTVTEAGTVAAAVTLEDSVTGIPPEGAGPLIVTVPTDPTDPKTLAGLTVRLLREGGLTVRLADLDTELRVAVTVP